MKKIVIMFLVFCMIITVAVVKGDIEPIEATEVVPEDMYTVSYNTSKYNIYWMCRYKVTCKSQYGSMWANLDKGDKLGTATIRSYYLEPKRKTGKYYYSISGCQVSMDPEDVAGNVSGMSQLAEFGIKTPEEDSRVCSPTVNELEIQASNSTSSNSSFTAGATLEYNSTSKKWEPSANLNYSSSWGASTTYTYNMTNVNLTQKNKNGEYAYWSYDYIEKNKNKTWNAYLMSSSKVAGQVVYRLDKKPTGKSKNRSKNAPSEIKYDIRFGAGDKSSGKVANRLGVSTNREMSVNKGTIQTSY